MGGRFTDRVVFLTGGGSGIGRATAQRFAAEGAKVFVVDVNRDGIDETLALVRQGDGTAAGTTCDVSSAEAVRAAVAEAVATFAGIDVLVNAAGIGGFKRFEEITAEDYARTMGVNVGGAFHTMQAAIPHLLARPGGCIVNIASTAAMRGTAYAAVYSASKAAVMNLTRSVALEYASRGLRANCIAPGGVRTPILRNFMPKGDFEQLLIDYTRPPVPGMFAEPGDIGAAILFLASVDARVINGAVLLADMGTLA